jgi:hypothetical protein
MLRGTFMRLRSRDSRCRTQETGRPRRSVNVRLGLVAFVASTMTACGPSEPQRCVDANGVIVPDSNCETSTTTHYYGHHWYYGGRGLSIGETASGGSFTPRSGVSYHSSTSRGGFGHWGSVHGFGHS